MHSSLKSASSVEKNGQLKTILERATPFINGELQLVDPKLPSLLSLLRSLGAAECWHKYGTFFDHLLHIYKILKLWNFSNSVSLSGLFHSAYSNSYVNPSIFNPSTSRQTVRDHIGEAAERLIYLFCNVPRHSVIHGDLISNFTDQEELIQHLKSSETSLRNAKEMGIFNSDEEWRKKLNSIIPSEGKSVKLIDTGEEIVVSRRVIAVFVCMTMADFSEQIFGYQDDLFENENGRLESCGNNLNALWPGDGKPGLWMNYISRMAATYSLLVREEEIFIEERKRVGENLSNEGRDEEIELVIPPVLENCTRVLDAEDQIMARDLYWEAVCNGGKKGVEIGEELLLKCIEKNPFVGEPHVVLSQIYLTKGRFEEGEREAEIGLRLLLEWGSPWDKRMSWEGWISWCRVLVMKAKEKSWPTTAWGILNLGLVR